MKKKGFTLIELLAVIVILAIIALIITPLISDLIESSRYASAVDSALAYVAGANNQVATDVGIGGFEDFSLHLPEEKELETDVTDEELAKIKYKGKGPTYVYLKFNDSGTYVEEAHFCIWGYSIDYNPDNGASKSDISYCGETEPEGVPSCDILNNNSYDDNDVFKINNVEDLVCISELAKTKTFENKTIYLIKDVDFNSDSSYVDPNNKTYGDINGNGSVEGLKVELTTGSGFMPISSSSVPFKGIFEGYAKTISNLMINRRQDNVGLFGYSQGKIQGLTISSNITGSTNVGGLVGYNDGGIINEIIASASITTNSDACGSYYKLGGLVGNLESGSVTSVLMKNSTISLPSSCRGHYVGGLVGRTENASNIISGVVETGTIKNDNGVLSVDNWQIGKISGSSSGTIIAYASNNMSGWSFGNHGTSYILNDEMLNTYDKVLDTYIGGDNDESGYYFDYENDSSSNIVIKRVTKNPIKFTLKGSGTKSDPYIIDNYGHFKEATTKSNGNYTFKITSDIDFEGRHYYSLGTNGNILGSDIDGDMHNLSNITLSCAENCGLISQSSKTIEGLNINNIIIASNNSNVGGLVGINTGVIKGINANNISVAGATNVGGLVGYNDGGVVNEVSASVSITTNSDACNSYYKVGGLVGNLESGSVTSILMKNSTISLPSSCRGHHVGGLVGRTENASNIISGAVETGAIKNDNGVLSLDYWDLGKISGSKSGTITGYASNNMAGWSFGNNGTGYTLIPPTTVTVSGEEIDSLTYYDSVGVLDTVIGGDNDNSGYYLQYNNSADSIIVVKAGTSGGVVNPGGEVNPSSPVPIIGESVGTNPPTCVLNEVIPRSNGIQAVLTCEDEEGAPTIRSQWNVNKNAVTNQFSDIGIIKNGSVNGNSKTVRPYWSTSNTISQPSPNDCYYYRFGAMDASGNYSYYVTENCYHAFTD